MEGPFNFSQAPFDCLKTSERQHLARHLDICFFPQGTCLHEKGSTVDTLYVVLKGMVAEESNGEILAYYGPQDSFDSRAMLGGLTQHRLSVTEDTLLYCFPRSEILALTQNNPLFGAFFYQDVAARLAILANRPLQGQLQGMLMARVDAAYLSPAHWLESEDTVLDAARLMQQHHVTCVLVYSTEGPGIFTRSELRDFVINGENAAGARIGPLAKRPLITIDAADYLYNAQLLMARHTIQRLVVTREALVIGILEQVELLSFLSNQSHIVLAQIERAESIPELLAASRSMDDLVSALHSSGVKVNLIAELLGQLRHHLLNRVFSLLAPPEMLEHACLLVLGSEGRNEQILRTDQDNALLLEDGYSHPQLHEVCTRFSQTLSDFGYPPCPGGIMLSRPEWCREFSAMRGQLQEWMRHANGENALRLAIWADACAIAGRSELLTSLSLDSFTELDSSFLAHFALPVLQFDVPLTLFSRLVAGAGDHQNRLDIKKGGIFPLVHGVRTLAVEARIRATNTFERIDTLVRLEVLPNDMAQDLRETLVFLQELRLQHGLDAMARNLPADNLIQPTRLSTLERDLLKDALGVVKHFRQFISHHFQLQRLT